MESPADYDESPLDSEEIYPCKGCGEILEEGKAFELAGNRWHLSCFRCNTCGLLLDSDANLLLLGDGSLICNNCTYSCSACNNKIEDLAILTGDQAFCATCFRCRNCKRKIENLRYARTSQGIFCMSCHESLMARRKKKSKAANSLKSKKDEQASVLVEKSLPALPHNASSQVTYPTDRKTSEPQGSETPTELSPRPHRGYLPNDSSSRSSSGRPRERSVELASGDEQNQDILKLQAKTYRSNRHSTIPQASDINGNDSESFFIPLALDPSSAPEAWSDSSRRSKENKFFEKDYFGLSRSSSKTQNEVGKSSHQNSSTSTPHHRAREPSSEENFQVMDSLWKTQAGSNRPSISENLAATIGDDSGVQRSMSTDATTRGRGGETFTLSEPPRGKNLISRSKSPPDPRDESSNMTSSFAEGFSSRNSRRESNAKLDSLNLQSSGEKIGMSRTSIDTRIDYGVGGATRSSNKRETPTKNNSINTVNSSSGVDTSLDTSPSSSSESLNSATTGNNSKITLGSSKLVSSTSDDRSFNLRPPSRPSQQLTNTYMSPRAPPLPPQTASTLSKANGAPGSQALPRWSQGGGDFTMDEDFARILGVDQEDHSQSILRRVSNAVRHGKNSSDVITSSRPGHGRSASETTTRTTISPRWAKSSKTDDAGSSIEISSPVTITSPDEISLLRRQLRNSEQRVAELEHRFSTEKDLKNLIKKVHEKRKTVSALDSQTEIMIQHIEALSNYMEKAKSNEPGQDRKEIEGSVVDEFIVRLQEIKQNISESIEALYEERNEILQEKIQITADRDRALLEFEQLSSKNAQLAEMNNDLTHQIQERLKLQGSVDSPRIPSNGLGIYSHPGKNKSSVSMPIDDISLRPSTSSTLFSLAYPPVIENDGSIDPTAVLSAPHLVNIRKGQATKKTFNWKKGRQTVAKGVSKGIKGAFSSTQQPHPGPSSQEQNKWQPQNGDGIGLPYNLTMSGIEGSITSPLNGQAQNTTRNISNDQKTQGGFGLFKKSNTMPKTLSNGNVLPSEKPSTLFGSELCERADYERRQIPSVVTRCIEEVELRGMDIEGIYRKTGGNSQVKTIQEGFEKVEDFDISDPGLDITAVTSVLKQYLRKLPTPLLTFDVYDRILESTFEDVHERCLHLRDTFSMLPPKHRDCLEFLIFHLTRVAVREKENLMNSKNLAVVFAPTIMRDTSLEREMTDMHAKNVVVQFIIENSYDIFGSP